MMMLELFPDPNIRAFSKYSNYEELYEVFKKIAPAKVKKCRMILKIFLNVLMSKIIDP